MKINESHIRKIVRKAINSSKKKSLQEGLFASKSSKLEDKIDKVFSNAGDNFEDLKLKKVYDRPEDAKRLEKAHSSWVKAAIKLKDGKKDKKRVAQKLQRMQYLIGLVLNPPELKKEPQETKPEPVQVADKRVSGGKPSKKSSTRKPKKDSKNKINIKKIQKIIKAPSSLTNKNDKYGGADGQWGKQTTAAWQKYFSDPAVLAKAKILHISNYGPQGIEVFSESISFKKKLILKRSDIVRLIKEAVETAGESVDDSNIIHNLKATIAQGKEGIGSVAILLGYNANMQGISDMLYAIESQVIASLPEEKFTDIEGYTGKKGAQITRIPYEGGYQVFKMGDGENEEQLTSDKEKSALKAWKRWAPWDMIEDDDEADPAGTSWVEYLDIDSADLRIDDKREYNSYYKCDAKDGLGPFVAKYHYDGDDWAVQERWTVLEGKPGVSGERIYKDSSEGARIFGLEGIATEENMLDFSEWQNRIIFNQSNDTVLDEFYKISKGYLETAKADWKEAFAEMSEFQTNENVVVTACRSGVDWAIDLDQEIKKLYEEMIQDPYEKFVKLKLVPDNAKFFNDSSSYYSLVKSLPTPLSVWLQVCYTDNNKGFKAHFKGKTKKLDKEAIVNYFKEFGGLETEDEIYEAAEFADSLVKNFMKDTLTTDI